jgi:AraC-like DNA-binding protein
VAAKRRAQPTPKDWQPLALPSSSGLLGPVMAHGFDELRISVAVWMDRDHWHPIHVVPDVTHFEYHYGAAPGRWAYNERCLTRAARDKRTVVGEHAGFFDLFAPIADGGIVVAGPFAKARPTAIDVRRRWQLLTGSHVRMSDPAFCQYLAATLSTLTLEGPTLEAFERLTTCFAASLGTKGDAAALAREADAQRRLLSSARMAERMWEAARTMVDERTSPTWAVEAFGEMSRLGIEHFPEHAVVGLVVGRRAEADPLDDALRRDALFCACVTLARQRGNVVCGKVGDHGALFLVDDSRPRARTHAALVDLVGRAADLARRLGLSLHAGIAQRCERAPLSALYRAALAAAERALSERLPVVSGQPEEERSSDRLRALRRELGASVGDRPKLLLPRFDGYIEEVLAHSGYRLELTSSHLEAGLERLSEPLLAGGFLDQRTFDALWASGQRAAKDARTVMELLASYRHIVSDIEKAIQHPTAARQERNTTRAQSFIREHLSEPLTLRQVARAAGFAPDYFWRLFKKSEGVTFTRYLEALRLSRAKEMLEKTSLSVEQIHKLCGFRSRTNFHRVFKKAAGVTPVAYRESPARGAFSGPRIGPRRAPNQPSEE